MFIGILIGILITLIAISLILRKMFSGMSDEAMEDLCDSRGKDLFK